MHPECCLLRNGNPADGAHDLHCTAVCFRSEHSIGGKLNPFSDTHHLKAKHEAEQAACSFLRVRTHPTSCNGTCSAHCTTYVDSDITDVAMDPECESRLRQVSAFFSDPDSQFYEKTDPRSASPARQNTKPKEDPIGFRATGDVILSGLHVAAYILLHPDLELLLNFGSNRSLRGSDVVETVTFETETRWKHRERDRDFIKNSETETRELNFETETRELNFETETWDFRICASTPNF